MAPGLREGPSAEPLEAHLGNTLKVLHPPLAEAMYRGDVFALRGWSEPLPGHVDLRDAVRWGGLRIARVERFALQAAAVRALEHDHGRDEQLGRLPARLAKCLQVPLGSAVVVNHSAKRQAASYRNLTTCGSVWACPCCAAKISERRRVELEQGITSWEALGGYVQLVTLTFPHTSADDLAVLLEGLRHALRRMWSGKVAAKQAARWGLAGQVRALEVTHGANGWHPHIHALMFFEPGSQSIGLLESLRARWRTACIAAGLLDGDDQEQLRAFEVRGVDVAKANLGAGRYLSKMGLDEARRHGMAAEVTKASGKRARGLKSRSPFGILSDFRDDGDVADAHLFAEYVAGFRGQRHLYWSTGLRKRLGMLVEKTDEEIAAEAKGEDEVALALIPLAMWRTVVRSGSRGMLLHVASSGDVGAIWAFIAELESRRQPERMLRRDAS